MQSTRGGNNNNNKKKVEGNATPGFFTDSQSG